jgi:hypothetical protein
MFVQLLLLLLLLPAPPSVNMLETGFWQVM